LLWIVVITVTASTPSVLWVLFNRHAVIRNSIFTAKLLDASYAREREVHKKAWQGDELAASDAYRIADTALGGLIGKRSALQAFYDQSLRLKATYSYVALFAASVAFICLMAATLFLIYGEAVDGVLPGVATSVSGLVSALFFRQAGRASGDANQAFRELSTNLEQADSLIRAADMAANIKNSKLRDQVIASLAMKAADLPGNETPAHLRGAVVRIQQRDKEIPGPAAR
jgi:hypothetical protein